MSQRGVSQADVYDSDESTAVTGWRWMSLVQTLVDVRDRCQSGQCPSTVNSRVRMEVDVTHAAGE